MAHWITCTQLDGRAIELNMEMAFFVTEESGGRAAVCFGSGERDRIVVRESKERVLALASTDKVF
ncbi:MAG TPA: hypothetical protein VGM17_04540 [Rhizomicrobium sp.]|jgi:hypothetical protein